MNEGNNKQTSKDPKPPTSAPQHTKGQSTTSSHLLVTAHLESPKELLVPRTGGGQSTISTHLPAMAHLESLKGLLAYRTGGE